MLGLMFLFFWLSFFVNWRNQNHTWDKVQALDLQTYIVGETHILMSNKILGLHSSYISCLATRKKTITLVSPLNVCNITFTSLLIKQMHNWNPMSQCLSQCRCPVTLQKSCRIWLPWLSSFTRRTAMRYHDCCRTSFDTNQSLHLEKRKRFVFFVCVSSKRFKERHCFFLFVLVVMVLVFCCCGAVGLRIHLPWPRRDVAPRWQSILGIPFLSWSLLPGEHLSMESMGLTSGDQIAYTYTGQHRHNDHDPEPNFLRTTPKYYKKSWLPSGKLT